MSLPQFAVRRPIFIVMVTLIVIVLGVISLWRLPVDLMPDITYPTISIVTSYSNASPEEMETLVTKPIEAALSAVPGVTEVTSTSTEGRSQVRVAFAWGTDLDAATSDVRDRLDRVIGRLPDDADRPMLLKFDLASFPVMMVGASSKLDQVQLRQLLEDQVKYRIERVPGVASMDIQGGFAREIHVNLLTDRMKALNISLDQIIAQIRAANVTNPAGTIERGNADVTIRTPGEFQSLDQIRQTVVATRNNSPILLAQVAEVDDTWQKVTSIVRVNGVPGLRLSVNKQSGTNTVQVAAGVLKEIEGVNADMPQLKLTPIFNTADYIQRSISNVSRTAFQGGLLAVLVLLFFLRSIRSTAIIALSIPVSIIATFTLLYFSGFTLNIMTLGGLALGVGMLVDNSIVVLENIFRLHQGGMPAYQAAIEGSGEVDMAIVASTLTTVVVFLPLVFVRGMAGVMFKQLSFVIGFSLLCSLIAAMTLVPMLSARLLKREEHTAHTGFWWRVFSATGRFFTQLESLYRDLLHHALNHRLIVVLITLGLLGGSLLLIPYIGAEFMPATDEGEVRVDVEGQTGTRLAVTDEVMRRVYEIVKAEVPEVDNIVSSSGGGGYGGGSSGSHAGQMRISLVPAAQRDRSSDDVAQDLRRKLSVIPGVTIRTRVGSGMFMLRMGSGGSERLQVEIRGFDFDAGADLADRVKAELLQIDGITDVRLSRQAGSPEELVTVERRKAADMRLTVSHVADALETILSGTRAGTYRESGDEYNILVKFKNSERLGLSQLLDQTVINADGQPVVLRNVVGTKPGFGPVRVDRKSQDRVIYVNGEIAGRDLGSVIADARQRLHNVPVPRDFSIVFGGDYEEQQKSNKELALSMGLALLLVYMVMACQYESLRDPFVVMFTVPLGAIGVIVTLMITKTTFNVQSFIGCIMLGGIVVNNAIVLVDHMNLLRRRDKMELRAAIEESGRRRLRPILMTTATTALGLLPLALGLGEGAEAQAPLARAVIGGLISSSLITLVFIPVVYSLFEGISPRKEETPYEN